MSLLRLLVLLSSARFNFPFMAICISWKRALTLKVNYLDFIETLCTHQLQLSGTALRYIIVRVCFSCASLKLDLNASGFLIQTSISYILIIAYFHFCSLGCLQTEVGKILLDLSGYVYLCKS